MDREFLLVLLRVVIFGGAVLIIGAGTLILAFRAFGPAPERSDFRPVILIAAVLFFVMVVCVVLLRLSLFR